LNGLLTTRQACKILGVNLYTLYSYIHTSTLRAHKLGNYTKRKHWRIKEADLEVFINGQVGTESTNTESSNKLVRNG